ncbi:MAG TPA: peptidase C39 family protein [Mycobacteriales bacterium]|nr:peptidase C39 family protein [Mycobacteriales bacterium]
MRVAGFGRSAVLVTAFSTVLLVAPALEHARASAPAVEHRDIDFHRYTRARDFAAGTFDGTATTPFGGLRFERATGQLRYDDPFGYPTRTYDSASWTSPYHHTGFGVTELVSSWNADTPDGTWLQVQMRGHTTTGALSKWYVMGRWARDDADFHRTSVSGQGDAVGDIATDTFVAADGVRLRDYQLRVTLYRVVGIQQSPSVRSVGAVASALPEDTTVEPGEPGGAAGIELPVPRYSQGIHADEYPQYGGGGEAWCSPTSTEMVAEYWGQKPAAAELSWVDPAYADPSVDVAARGTFDYQYDGTGNWPFNVAYATRGRLTGEVTQLRTITELEEFIKFGIPVITSVSFKADELDGAGYSTDGHLMVVVGFTKNGDVIANDPASSDDAAVRHVYNRAQFANVWLPSTRSHGIAYLIHPSGWPLPPHPAGLPHNW